MPRIFVAMLFVVLCSAPAGARPSMAKRVGQQVTHLLQKIPHRKYVFHQEWNVAAPPARVFRVLSQMERYPLWWREVKTMNPRGKNEFDATIKSILPYSLRMTLTRVANDPAHGLLESRMTGDLEGHSAWQLGLDDLGGTRLVFDETAATTKPLFNLLALLPPARLAFRMNHALMMYHARKGLAAQLQAAPR